MNIPKKIKIGGLTFKVKFEENYTAGRHAYGSMIPMNQEIIIDKTLSKEMQENTFIHEIIEVLTCIYELNLEHRVISTLDTAIYQIIKDNPGMFKVEPKKKKVKKGVKK